MSLDHSERSIKPNLRSADIIQRLVADPLPSVYSDVQCPPKPHFFPEGGSFNIETTPGEPWGIDNHDLLDVELNMRWRSVLSIAAMKYWQNNWYR